MALEYAVAATITVAAFIVLGNALGPVVEDYRAALAQENQNAQELITELQGMCVGPSS